MNVFFHTFGCKANQYDTELVRQAFTDGGAVAVESIADADVAIVNSCTVTQTSEAKLRTFVRRLARGNPALRTVVMGCAAARDTGTLAALPGVRAVIGGADPASVLVAAGAEPRRPDPRLRRFAAGARAWLKIQDGCDEHCTFCATTIARGANRSRSVADIVAEAGQLAQHHAEIVLTGVHIGTYGKDDGGVGGQGSGVGGSLGELLDALVNALPDVRFRLSSVEATEVDERLESVMAEAPRHVAGHLHAPLQSGSDRILKRMGRHWYSSHSYRERVEQLAERIAPFGLGADVIAGFPGETEADHAATLALIEALPFTYLHVFPYSARPDVAAGRLPDPVPAAQVRARAAGLRALSDRKAASHRAARCGATADGVVSGRQGGRLEVLTEDYLTVYYPSEGWDLRPVRGHDRLMPRLYVETYGCQMNVADSDLIIGVLGAAGYERTDDPAAADVVLVNTCAVRDHAEQRVLGRMGELKGLKRPGGVLGVVGCMAQRLGPRLLEKIPQVDLVVGPDGYRGLPELIARARGGERAADVEFRAWEHYEDVPPVDAPFSAFVTVQRGCDYRCTFCVVPMTRGPERSRKLADVVREVTELVARGTTEVTLLGQTVNSYHDGTYDFADLLRAVGGVAGVRRLRFTSPYPTDFTDRVLAAMAETPSSCEHVHLPVQSGSSRTLKRMLRRYTRERYLEVVDALRLAMPAIALTTDIIVGFPGESEDEFAETLSLVEAVAFDDAYTFKYSPREGTPATRLHDGVPDDVAGERLQRLIAVVRGVARRKNVGLVGTTHEVLVEGRAKRGGLLQTRTRTNKVALVDGPDAWIGTYAQVRFTGTTGSTFTGSIVERELAVVG